MDVTDVSHKIDIELIKQHILKTSIIAWDNRITNTSLERWLNNFTGAALGDIDAEKTIAAWLLMNFTYYSSSEVQELCKVIFRKYIHYKLEEDSYKKMNLSNPDKIRLILEKTIFIPLGNPSESGSLILYNFRTANKLPKNIFENKRNWKDELQNGTIDNIVLVDDVTLSGTQAIEYVKDLNYGNTKIILLTFFSTNIALQRMKQDAPQIYMMCAQLLDERTKMFADSSFSFSNDDTNSIKELARKLCLYYGNIIVQNELPEEGIKYMKSYPLGFGDGQQTFGFYYNIPDNTLPIFWCNSKHWHAAFERFSKVYSLEGVEISDEKYW